MSMQEQLRQRYERNKAKRQAEAERLTAERKAQEAYEAKQKELGQQALREHVKRGAVIQLEQYLDMYTSDVRDPAKRASLKALIIKAKQEVLK